MIRFQNKILFVGYGAVAECTLPIFFKHVKVPPRNVTVMDCEDRAEKMRKWTVRGVRFVRDRVTRDNLGALLGQYLGAGDLLIDLAWNIDACEILQWCHDHGVLYVNTSTELWDPYHGLPDKHPTTRTLYWRHLNLRRLAASWKEKGPTAVIEHGANPGLISHFTKQGLIDIGSAAVADGKLKARDAEFVAQFIRDRQFNHLARKLGVKVIHCQRARHADHRPPQGGGRVRQHLEHRGLPRRGHDDGRDGVGHPREMAAAARLPPQTGPEEPDLPRPHGHQHLGPILGSQLQHPRHGRAPRRGLHHLRPPHRPGEGRAVYRPTVHYAYCPCDCAIASLHELRGYRYELNARQRIMNDEITSGSDILGALIMGHAYNSWWIGSDLSIEESRRLVPHQNATTMQVAISVVAASMWMMENPAMGLCVPDDLPHDTILGIAKPYLAASSPRPPTGRRSRTTSTVSPAYGQPKLDRRDPWQFRNFLISDGNE